MTSFNMDETECKNSGMLKGRYRALVVVTTRHQRQPTSGAPILTHHSKASRKKKTTTAAALLLLLPRLFDPKEETWRQRYSGP